MSKPVSGAGGATPAGSPETRSRDGPRPHACGHTRSGPRGALSLLDGVRPHPEAPGLGGVPCGFKVRVWWTGSMAPLALGVPPSPGLVSCTSSNSLVLQLQQVLQPGRLHLQDLQENKRP